METPVIAKREILPGFICSRINDRQVQAATDRLPDFPFRATSASIRETPLQEFGRQLTEGIDASGIYEALDEIWSKGVGLVIVVDGQAWALEAPRPEMDQDSEFARVRDEYYSNPDAPYLLILQPPADLGALDLHIVKE